MALGRGLFASKGWKARYCFVVREGFGYSHKNPRETGGVGGGGGKEKTALRHLRPSDAKSFIPFDKKSSSSGGGVGGKGEVSLLPVYLVRDVSLSGHPDLPNTCINGVCRRKKSEVEGTSGAEKVHSSGGSDGGSYYYYFALTFEEHKKRYLLFLRTSDWIVYLNFVSFLPIYVHVGSAQTIIPIAHPLEIEKPIPVDMHVKKYGSPVSNVKNNNTKGYYFPSTYEYVKDPDPCTEGERKSTRRRVLSWDEGENQRVIKQKILQVKKLRGEPPLDGAVTPEELERVVEKEKKEIFCLFDEVAPSVPDDVYENGEGENGMEESQHRESDNNNNSITHNNNNDNNKENNSEREGSVNTDGRKASSPQKKHVDPMASHEKKEVFSDVEG